LKYINLCDKIKIIAGSSNGRTPGFGPGYLGSSPSPAAIFMKYFIGYLIQGDAATWHTQTVKDISEKFDTRKLYERIPPHITIVKPFESGDVSSLKAELPLWTDKYVGNGYLSIDGFGHFDTKVIFANVNTDKSLIEKIEILWETLKINPDFSPWKPHATLASHLDPDKFEKVWQYIENLEKPNFILPFDNITLFELRENKWEVFKTFNK
jgi:2'-5' RNA ligase